MQTFAFQAHFHPWILFNQGYRILSTFCKIVESIKKIFIPLEKKLWIQKTQGEGVPPCRTTLMRHAPRDSLSHFRERNGWKKAICTQHWTCSHSRSKTDTEIQNSGNLSDFPFKNQKAHSEQFQPMQLKKDSGRVALTLLALSDLRLEAHMADFFCSCFWDWFMLSIAVVHSLSLLHIIPLCKHTLLIHFIKDGV